MKTTLLNDIESVGYIDRNKHSTRIRKLVNELNLIKQKQKYENNKRILYLVEQSAIAKELGIDTNTLDANALAQTPSSGVVVEY